MISVWLMYLLFCTAFLWQDKPSIGGWQKSFNNFHYHKDVIAWIYTLWIQRLLLQSLIGKSGFEKEKQWKNIMLMHTHYIFFF